MEVPLLSNPPGVRFFIFLNFFVKSGGDGGFVVLLGWPETCIVWARPGWPSGFLRGLSVTVLSLHEGDPLPASSSLPSLPVRSYRQHGLLSTLMMTTASCTHTADPSSWWMYGNVCMSICFFFFFPVAQRSLTCIQLVSEGRFWLGPDTWWYKSPLEFNGGNPLYRQSFRRLLNSINPQMPQCFKTLLLQPHTSYPYPTL